MRAPSQRAVLTGAGALAILGVGGGAGAGIYAALAPASTTTVLAASSGPAQSSPATGSGDSVGGLYKRSYRGVVDITVSERSQGFAPAGLGGGGSEQAEGSGFVYDGRGDVITNDHVVLGATAITVELWNGRTFRGRLVGSDESTDLAVVHIDAPAPLLHPLRLGDSAALAVGDPVVAIGSPFGLPETVTSGIVSALHRVIDSPNNFSIGDAIQTDAAINHGNSGGPLLDASGEVIGINSQIQSQSGGSNGVGFAIPSDTVASVVAQIVAHRPVAHAYLGVEVADSSSPPGAAVDRVLPGTPAALAGLARGDVITALGGQTVTDGADLAAVLTGERPGERLVVQFRRAARTRTVTIRLANRPA
jgi:putative serine protease PepD